MSENTTKGTSEKRDRGPTQAELDRYVRSIAREGEALLLALETRENQKKLDRLMLEIRQRKDDTAGKQKLAKPKKRPPVPIEPERIEKFMRTLRRGDRITYRIGKPWGKPRRGVIKRIFPHIVLLEGGTKSDTVMPFDILKCELGLIDDGWNYEK